MKCYSQGNQIAALLRTLKPSEKSCIIFIKYLKSNMCKVQYKIIFIIGLLKE